mgnify:CR=1 FL=1
MDLFGEIFENIYNYSQENFRIYEKSSIWYEYLLGNAKNHCIKCLNELFKIYYFNKLPILPKHAYCKCYIIPLRKLYVGQATLAMGNGVDVYLYRHHKLPNNYITKGEARKLGWKPIFGNLDQVASGFVIGGDVFYNRQGKLPDSPGRVWYECDIDYLGGYRNNSRIIYSNDGLIFKTDCHYKRFISIEGR